MNNTYEIALSEVCEILMCLPEDIQIKIPQKLISFIKEKKQDNYDIKSKKPLCIQNYSKEAIILLGMIYVDYLCSQEEKILYKNKEKELKEQYQKELLEGNSLNKSFNQKNTTNSSNESTTKQEQSLLVIKTNWFTKAKEYFNRIIKKIIK